MDGKRVIATSQTYPIVACVTFVEFLISKEFHRFVTLPELVSMSKLTMEHRALVARWAFELVSEERTSVFSECSLAGMGIGYVHTNSIYE